MNFNELFLREFSAVEPKTPNEDFILDIRKKAGEAAKHPRSGNEVHLTEITVNTPPKKPVPKGLKIFAACAGAAAVIGAGFIAAPMLAANTGSLISAGYGGEETAFGSAEATGVPETAAATAVPETAADTGVPETAVLTAISSDTRPIVTNETTAEMAVPDDGFTGLTEFFIDDDTLKFESVICGAFADGSGNYLGISWSVAPEGDVPAHDYVLYTTKGADIYIGENTVLSADTGKWEYETEIKLRVGTDPREQAVCICTREQLEAYRRIISEGGQCTLPSYGAYIPDWRGVEGELPQEGGIVGTAVDTTADTAVGGTGESPVSALTHTLDSRMTFDSVGDAGSITVYLKKYIYDVYTARIYYDVTFNDGLPGATPASPISLRFGDMSDQIGCATIHGDDCISGNTASFVSTVGFRHRTNEDRRLDIMDQMNAFYPMAESLASFNLKVPQTSDAYLEAKAQAVISEDAGISETIPFVSVSPLSMRFSVDSGGEIHERMRNLRTTPIFPVLINYTDGTSERWVSSGTGLNGSDDGSRVVYYIPNDGEPLDVSKIESIEFFGDTSAETG